MVVANVAMEVAPNLRVRYFEVGTKLEKDAEFAYIGK